MDAVLLFIETASPICSVCVSRGKEVIATAKSIEANVHASMLAVLIQQVLEKANVRVCELQAVCVSEGPGSYTGLRIGLSTAKGICYAAELPLILIPTLQAMAHGIKQYASAGSTILPVLDARRNDVYFSLYNYELEELIAHTCSSVSEVNALVEQRQLKAVAAGTGIEKLTPFTQNISLVEETVIDAANMVPIGLEKFYRNDFADLAYAEPVYRK